MGEVYRASDTQLHRDVALKRVRQRSHDDQKYRRYLLNEARRASAFNDPRVAGIYDVFEHGDDFFVVMEYVEGVTLRKRMESPVSIPEFLQIANQCVQGLSAAHDNGIIHGDIKPENIMLSSRTGGVKICDFGLARRSSTGDDVETGSATSDSVKIDPHAGTPAYMSPEALTGRPVTASADIFSLGVTFYEMLSGRNPFRAGDASATANRIISETPPALDAGPTRVPAEVAAIVTRMIEKDPSLRYRNAAELRTKLEVVSENLRGGPGTRWRKAFLPAAALLFLVGLVIAVAAAFSHRASDHVLSKPEVRNLVVLPFDAVGSTPAQRFQADGLSETLNAALVKLGVGHNLQVLPASDVQARNVKSLEDARKELGATLVLSGTVQYSEKLVRVNAVLTDGGTRKQLQAETITVDAANPFLMQDRIVEAAVDMLGIQLLPVEHAALQQHGTYQLGAYEFYLQGRGYLLNFDRLENQNSAIELFQRALKIDPHYSLAYAGLGEALLRKFNSTKDNDLVASARNACQSAVSQGPKLAASHLCLGLVYSKTGEYEKAISEFNLSLQIDPALDAAYGSLGLAYEQLHQRANAEQTYRRAIDMKPQYWAYYDALGRFYYRTNQYDLAREMFLWVVSLAPDSFRGYSTLGAIYHAQGRTADAIKAFEKSLSIRPFSQAASNLGTIRFFQGDYKRAAELYMQALSLDPREYIVWGNLGAARHWLGQQNEANEAFKEARKRAEERLKVNPLDTTVLMHLAEYNGALGNGDEAISYIQRARAQAPDDSGVLFKAAVVYEYNLNRREDALSLLGKAIEQGYSPEEIDRSPSLSELRKDQRFAELRNHH
jgi:serine/threonine-protein kinase